MVISKSCFLKHSIKVTTRVRKIQSYLIGDKLLSQIDCFDCLSQDNDHKQDILENYIKITHHQLNYLMGTTQSTIIWHVFVFLFHVLTWNVNIIATFMLKNQNYILSIASCFRRFLSKFWHSFARCSLFCLHPTTAFGIFDCIGYHPRHSLFIMFFNVTRNCTDYISCRPSGWSLLRFCFQTDRSFIFIAKNTSHTIPHTFPFLDRRNLKTR